MRFIAIVAVSIVAVLAKKPDIPFKDNLGCGACVGGGNVYCQTPRGQGIPHDSVCCSTQNYTQTLECALMAVAANMSCATKDPNFSNTTREFYGDDFNMLFDFCSAPNKAACDYPKGNNTIEVGNNTVNISINQNSLGYGNTCTYKVYTGCGYPKFKINGQNLDVKLAFNS